ncbi:MAG: PEP-CTERM sorting domain-containing protein [Verrucomicrobiota bacterium]
MWHNLSNQLTRNSKPMKTIIVKNVCSITSVIAGLALAVLPAKAQVTYYGPGVANGGGGSGTEINSVVVNNNATAISFTVTSASTLSAYIQYYVLMQYVGQGGSGSTALLHSAGALNGWGPSLGISTGENAFIATYYQGSGGATPAYYSGGVWTQGSGVGYVAGGPGDNYVTFSEPLSSLGLSAGSSFYFDVVSGYANNSGQSAYGSLDSYLYPAETDDSYKPYLGSNAYDPATDASGTDFGTSSSEYTVTGVPEPATCALIGLGGLVMIGRMVRRNAV